MVFYTRKSALRRHTAARRGMGDTLQYGPFYFLPTFDTILSKIDSFISNVKSGLATPADAGNIKAEVHADIDRAAAGNLALAAQAKAQADAEINAVIAQTNAQTLATSVALPFGIQLPTTAAGAPSTGDYTQLWILAAAALGAYFILK